MLTFIITLLMALVFSVGGINIPSSSSGNLNTTDATLFRRSDEFLPCSPDTGAFEKCWCFSFESDTVDVPRTPMIDGESTVSSCAAPAAQDLVRKGNV